MFYEHSKALVAPLPWKAWASCIGRKFGIAGGCIQGKRCTCVGHRWLARIDTILEAFTGIGTQYIIFRLSHRVREGKRRAER